jgi:hypothetical protein
MASITGIRTPCHILFCGETFSNIAKHPIPNDDNVNIGICVIHRTGLFAEEYKTWITCGNNSTNTKDFVAFCTSWKTAINIACFTAIPASQHGFGMNAVEVDAFATSEPNAKFGSTDIKNMHLEAPLD